VKLARLTAAAAAVIAILGVAQAAHAQPKPATYFVIKGQDLAPWATPYETATCPVNTSNPPVSMPPCYQSEGVQAAAQSADITLPAWSYVLCGSWDGTQYGLSDYTACHPGDSLPVFENELEFAAAVEAGEFTKLHLTHAVYDIETWAYTPPPQQSPMQTRRLQALATPMAQKGNPGKWIGRFIRLGRQHGISVAVTPGGGLDQPPIVATASRDRAWLIGVQSQAWGCSSTCPAPKTAAAGFRHRLARFITAIDSARKQPPVIMAGLATNLSGLVHSPQLLTAEYRAAQSLGVPWIWINADNHGAESACTARDDGEGCPAVAVQFLEAIGAAS
jgi:hypothetical protein